MKKIQIIGNTYTNEKGQTFTFSNFASSNTANDFCQLIEWCKNAVIVNPETLIDDFDTYLTEIKSEGGFVTKKFINESNDEEFKIQFNVRFFPQFIFYFLSIIEQIERGDIVRPILSSHPITGFLEDNTGLVEDADGCNVFYKIWLMEGKKSDYIIEIV